MMLKTLEFSKKPKSKINFKTLESWDPFEYSLVAKIRVNNRSLGLVLLSKNAHTNIELMSIVPGRIPVTIRSATTWYNMSNGIVLYNHRVTEKNAKSELFKNMTPNEIVIDWETGWYYHRERKTVKRYEILDYYFVDRQQVINWRGTRYD